MFIMVPLPAECSSEEPLDYKGSDADDVSVSGGNASEEADDAADNTELSPALSPAPEVALNKYFLVFNLNGTLIHFLPGRIQPGSKEMKKSQRRARPGLREFLNFCLDCEFEIIFWSCVKEDNLIPRIKYIQDRVPRLPEDCLTFGQNLCRESNYRDPAFPNRPVLLKPLSLLLKRSTKLQALGATVENTLLIDDTPYKNVLNNPYNALHPPTCTMYTERKLKPGVKPFLNQTLQPFLFKLRSSGCTVPEFCEAHHKIGKRRMFPSDPLYHKYKELVPYATL